MSTLRILKKAARDIYKWLMKYSGMTMIIDNVEERRRKRESLNHSEEPSDTRSSADPPLKGK
jgi:hypothetical protein